MGELESSLSLSEFMGWVKYFQFQNSKEQDPESSKDDLPEVDWANADLTSIFGKLEK